MTRSITIGEHEVLMTANGATPYRFKNLFKEDIFAIMLGQADEKDGGEIMDMSGKLAYIMAMQAEGADMNKLTEESFYSWLEQFDAMDVAQAGEEIYMLYVDQTQQLSTAKKKQLTQNGK